MAKYKRQVIGSVVKSKAEEGQTPGADYIKIRDDVKLLKGQTLRLESKKSQLESLEKAIAEGKLTEEIGEKARERIEKIPDWVRFEIVLLNKE